jgi:hypothetical protein
MHLLCHPRAPQAYNATRFAKQGDLGTEVLPKRSDLYQTVWTRGAVEKTRWEITAQHGGGYIYQLCKASSNKDITEECFASNPLEFAKPYTQRMIFSDPSKDYDLNMTVVAEGGGTGWAFNPFIYSSNAPCDWNPSVTGEHCKWNCKKCGAPWYAADGACPDPNCGHHKELPSTINYGKGVKYPVHGGNTIEDSVVVPTSIPVGEYVLRWRWDCEASSQVWTTCSDITIV